MSEPSARFATCPQCDRSKSDYLAIRERELYETTWPHRLDAMFVFRSCGVTDMPRPISPSSRS